MDNARITQNTYISTNFLGAIKTCELGILIAIERNLMYLYNSINPSFQSTGNNALFSDHYLHC